MENVRQPVNTDREKDWAADLEEVVEVPVLLFPHPLLDLPDGVRYVAHHLMLQRRTRVHFSTYRCSI
jgi:hypothetical protein